MGMNTSMTPSPPIGSLYLNRLMNQVHTVISRTIVQLVQRWSQKRNRQVSNQ